jgi:hypothetical protein
VRPFLNTPANHEVAAMKLACVLWAGQTLDPGSHVDRTPAAQLDLCNKDLCYFMCQNAGV